MWWWLSPVGIFIAGWLAKKLLDLGWDYARLAWRRLRLRFRPQSFTAEGFSLGIVQLENDPDREIEKLIERQVEGLSWIKAYRVPVRIPPSDVGEVNRDLESRRTKAEEIARKYHLSAVLWGDVLSVSGHKQFVPHLTSQAAGGRRSATKFGAASVEPSTFSIAFEDSFALQLRVLLLNVLISISSKVARFGLAEEINTTVRQAEVALDDPSWPVQEKSTLALALVRLLRTAGYHGAVEYLDRAHALATKRLASMLDANGLAVAGLKLTLADILQLRSERRASGHNSDLQSALELSKAAAQTISGIGTPQMAANARVFVAGVMLTLGWHPEYRDFLIQSIPYNRDTLAMLRLDEAPRDWGLCHMRIGVAYSIIGESNGDAASLGKALSHFQKALEVWTESEDPVDWGELQSNIGLVLWRRGKLTNSREDFLAALDAHERSLRVRTETGSPKLWAETWANVGLVRYELARLAADFDGVAYRKHALESLKALDVAEVKFTEIGRDADARRVSSWSLPIKKALAQDFR